MEQIQYVSDEHRQITGVIVPITLWREIESERETAYLLKSDVMKRRLLEAKQRTEGIPFDDACETLGIWTQLDSKISPGGLNTTAKRPYASSS